jgi:hypothetical protein
MVPIMKVRADDKKRIVLTTAKPGDCFEVLVPHDGTIILTKLEPARLPKARLKRSNGRTLLVGDRRTTLEDVQRVMATFP